jgi:glycine cleavage system regulatory protein
MDGAIDIRLIVTLLGVAASIFGGAAVAKMRIKDMQEHISEIHAILKANDKRIDILENYASLTTSRVDILAKLSNPENLRRDHIAMAELTSSVTQLRKEMDHQLHIHNSKHIPVPSERVGT